MKNKLFASLTRALLSTLNSQLSTLHAQGTAFTYNGRLSDGGPPANGNYDLTFSLFEADSGPTQVGSTLTNSATAGGGLFNISADAITGGLTTNIAVLVPGGFTNILSFTNGILRAIQ